MAATEKQAPEMTALTCEVCGFVATGRQGLASHKRNAHGVQMNGESSAKRKTPEPDLDKDMLREIDDALNAATKALEVRLIGIDKEIADTERRTRQLRSTRRYLASRLRSINPDALPEGKPGPKKPEPRGMTRDTAKIEAVEVFVRDTDGEFVSSDIYSDMRDGREEGGVVVSSDIVRRVIRDMHARGELRAVRIAKGGGQVYELIGARNGA